MLVEKRIKDLFNIKAGGDLDDMIVEKEITESCIFPIYANSAFNEGVYGYTNSYQYKKEAITITARGNLGISFYRNSPFSAIGRLLITFPKKKITNLKYINYILQLNTTVGNQTAIPQLTAPEFGNKIINIFKSKVQQTAIANYLDHHTTKLDKEISLLEQKVEKLDEYKQSLIYECVTKGLDKTVPMKDSGIEWIGMIPKHWEVKRVKDLFDLKGGGADKKIIDGEELVNLVNFVDVFKKITLNNNQEYMVVSCPKDKIKFISLKKDDLLITPSSETADEVGFVNIVLENLNNTVFSYHILRLRNKSNHINLKYAYYYFNSKFSGIQFENKATGTTRVTLSRYDINSNYILISDLKEQQQIADHLDEKCFKINKKKELINKKIELLKEYKQSLIYESVTGKIITGDKNGICL